MNRLASTIRLPRLASLRPLTSMAGLDNLKWTASFTVSKPPSGSRLSLRGDKINLPQSSLEQLLAASPTTSTTSAGTFTAFDPFNPYSVAAAREERSLHRENSQQLPNPLMFRIVNQENGNVVYAGIREFSAEEGEVALSQYLMDSLGIEFSGSTTGPADGGATGSTVGGGSSQPRVTVHAKQLDRGTYVRLRPLEAGYNPDDWKALLERELRNSYTTITKDAMLSVHGVKGEEFRFLVDKILPEGDGICVVDTDLEVDIEALDEEQARETLRQIVSRSKPGGASGSSSGGEIDIWKAAQGQVVSGDYVDYLLPSWDRSSPITVEVSGIDDKDAIDLFITPLSRLQRALPRDFEHVFGNFDTAQNGSKSITIQPTNVALDGADKLMIAVHGYQGPTASPEASRPYQFTIRAKVAVDNVSNQNSDHLDTPAILSPEDVQCKNCLQHVPRRTLMLHENFCLRNNVICPRCRQVFKKSSEQWNSHWHCQLDKAFGDSAERYVFTTPSRMSPNF